MGKKKVPPPKPRTTPRSSVKGKRARKPPIVRNCAKCLEKHEAPTGKRCARLQMPGLQVGSYPVPGPPGLYLPSSEAESVSAEEIRLASARFPAASSTDESTPPRPRGVLRAVSFDERTYELDGGPDSLDTELAPEYDEEEGEEGSDEYDDLEGSGQEDELEADSLHDVTDDQQMENDDQLDTFN